MTPTRKKNAPACLIEGARTHNLKGIHCRIPFGQMTAITGVSGSGKSTLAFDVLYAEGQRRFVDCLSTYARQFLQRLDRPDVDHIGEIQPPIAMKQQVSIRNARSTVGSITELSDLLHLLFAHGGTPHCPRDGSELVLRTTESAAKELRELEPGGRYVLTADVRLPASGTASSGKAGPRRKPGAAAAKAKVGTGAKSRTGRVAKAEAAQAKAATKATKAAQAAQAKRAEALAGTDAADLAQSVARGYVEQGYTRILRDGQVAEWSPPWTSGTWALVVDRFSPRSLTTSRSVEAVEAAWRLGSGTAVATRTDPSAGQTVGAGTAVATRAKGARTVAAPGDAAGTVATPAEGERTVAAPGEAAGTVATLIEGLSCPTCHERTRPLRPQLFSPNSPLGACPRCNGFGRTVFLDRDKVVPDGSLTLAQGAVAPFETKTGAKFRRKMIAGARDLGVPLDLPFRELSPAAQDWVFTGAESPAAANGVSGTSAAGTSAAGTSAAGTGAAGTGAAGAGAAGSSAAGTGARGADAAGTVAGGNCGAGGNGVAATGAAETRAARKGSRKRAGYGGVEGLFRRLERKRYRPHVRIFLARYRGYETCPECRGSRLHPVALSVTLGGLDLAALEQMPVRELVHFLGTLRLSDDRLARTRSVFAEVRERLGYLVDVGLGYLTLARTARTLSGGETQRIRLATGLGTSLTETLYVLDEPTVGLHATDTARMLSILRKLCASGNTVVVVEHDPGIVLHADHLIVLGPSGGEGGGEVLYEGSASAFHRRWPDFFRADIAPGSPLATRPLAATGPPTATGPLPATGPPTATEPLAATGTPTGLPASPPIELRGIRAHNLEVEALAIPTDRLVVVTGVSGSGKSTLIESVLHRNALRFLGKPVEDIGHCDVIEGLVRFEDVLLVSQNPLGRSSRSTLISYTGLLTNVRKRLAATPRAKELKLRPGDFSFNVAGGRCETCKGMGSVLLEMHFLADVEIACEVCRGKRFRDDVLEVTAWGRSILQIMDLTVTEALRVFAGEKDAVRRLTPLVDIGLGYLRLGQSTSTLSGGEAQRLRLAQLLSEGADTRRIFLFDEPTSGLHPQDIRKLLVALRGLVAMNHAVIVVEHQLDFIASADWIIDLGPGGGDEGGELLYSGPVAELLDLWQAGGSARTGGPLPGGVAEADGASVPAGSGTTQTGPSASATARSLCESRTPPYEEFPETRFDGGFAP